MATAERSFITPPGPPRDAEGKIDYSQIKGLDRYRKTDRSPGLDATTIEDAVKPINKSAEKAKITQFHAALAANAVSQAYLAEFGASPSTINRKPETATNSQPEKSLKRGPITMAQNVWNFLRQQRQTS